MSNKPKRSQSSLTSSILKPLGAKRPALQSIFTDNKTLGWQVLDAQSLLYSQTQVTVDKITALTGYYMKIIERLNSLQDPREQYFTFKMQKLMSQPYIIRCFGHQQQPQSSQKTALEGRRKQLEQNIEKQAERQNHKAIVEQTLQNQTQKQQRMRNTLKNATQDMQRRLQQRIKKRTLNRLQRSRDYSCSFDCSLQSQASVGSDKKRQKQNTNDSRFELRMLDQSRFKNLKRRVEEEEEEQARVYRLDREMSLWKKEG